MPTEGTNQTGTSTIHKNTVQNKLADSHPSKQAAQAIRHAIHHLLLLQTSKAPGRIATHILFCVVHLTCKCKDKAPKAIPTH